MILQKPILIITLTAIITAFGFVVLEDSILGHSGIEISKDIGQYKSGFYEFADYTPQVNNLINNKSLILQGYTKVMSVTSFLIIVQGKSRSCGKNLHLKSQKTLAWSI